MGMFYVRSSASHVDMPSAVRVPCVFTFTVRSAEMSEEVTRDSSERTAVCLALYVLCVTTCLRETRDCACVRPDLCSARRARPDAAPPNHRAPEVRSIRF